MADTSGTNASVTPNTQESINTINANMTNVLDFQNQTHAALSLWGARLSVNAKSWQLVDQAIASMQR